MTDPINEKLDSVSDTPESELQNIVEAALYAADEPLTIRKIQALFLDGAQPSKDDIVVVLDDLILMYETRGIELVKVGGGWRFQTREKYSTWMRRLQASKAPRFSRAQLETMAIIAYQQPVTRGDIEDVRGVAVSSDIIRILEERGWIREIGHRDVPGRPALFGTTQDFLAYFNLQSLRELPELIDKRRFEDIAKEMHMQLPVEAQADETAEGESEQSSADVIPLHGDDGVEVEVDADDENAIEAVEETNNELDVEGETQKADDIENSDPSIDDVESDLGEDASVEDNDDLDSELDSDHQQEQPETE